MRAERTAGARRRFLRDGLAVLALGLTLVTLVATSPPSWFREVAEPAPELVLEAPWDVEVLGYHAVADLPGTEPASAHLKMDLRADWQGASGAAENAPEVGLSLLGGGIPVRFDETGKAELFDSVRWELPPRQEHDLLVTVTRAGPYGEDAAASGPVTASGEARLSLWREGDEPPPDMELSLERRETWHLTRVLEGHRDFPANTVGGGSWRHLTVSTEVDVTLGFGLLASSRWIPAAPGDVHPEVRVYLENAERVRLASIRFGGETSEEQAGGHVFVRSSRDHACGPEKCAERERLTLAIETDRHDGELLIDWQVRVDAFGFGPEPYGLDFRLER